MSSYRLNEEKMFVDVTDGVAIVINSETGIYYGMTPLSTQLFEALRQGVSLDDLEAQLRSRRGCPSDIRRRLDDFVGALLASEIIVPGGDSKSVSLPDDCTKEGWEISIQDYSDAKGLLLADPVETMGD